MSGRKRPLFKSLRVMSLLIPAGIMLAGCDQERDGVPATAGKQSAPPPTVTERVDGEKSAPPKAETVPLKTADENATEDVDLIGDKPEAKANDPKKPALLDDMKPSGPLCKTARECYVILGDIKSNVERISADLDDNGKEVHRLIRTSDALSKNITDLANVWPEDKLFREACGTAKRSAVLLNDELSRVPRQWSHVRWAFRDTLVQVSRLRSRAREMAEAEPKPQPLLDKSGKPVLDKDGRMTYIEPGEAELDPATQKRLELQKKVNSARERERRQEEAKKNKAMPTELDSR